MTQIAPDATPVELTAAGDNSPAEPTVIENDTVENACRDIDRYVAETSQAASAAEEPMSPSQRLQALGRRQAGTFQPPLTVGMLETPLFPDKG
jgi:hypothetical protein